MWWRLNNSMYQRAAVYPTRTSTTWTPLRFCPSFTNSWRTRGAQIVPSTTVLLKTVTVTIIITWQPLQPPPQIILIPKTASIRHAHVRICLSGAISSSICESLWQQRSPLLSQPKTSFCGRIILLLLYILDKICNRNTLMRALCVAKPSEIQQQQQQAWKFLREKSASSLGHCDAHLWKNPNHSPSEIYKSLFCSWIHPLRWRDRYLIHQKWSILSTY